MKFEIPFLPVSMNAIYEINHIKRRVYLKSDAISFKTKAKLCIPKYDIKENEKSIFIYFIHRDWWYKNKKMRRCDVGNFEKILIDSVCERQGWDDKNIWMRAGFKIQSKKEKVTIILLKDNGYINKSIKFLMDLLK